MKYVSMFDKIDLHLIRVLHTVLTERSVSRAALRLGMYQPAVSASLKRLRELAGDPLLVRSGASMVPTVAGLRMVEPAAEILRSAEMLFSDARAFDPATATARVITADHESGWIGGPPIQSNYLGPTLLEWLPGDRFAFASE